MPSNSKRRDRQVVRILGILGALLDGARPSVHDLARKFGTRRETIYRDLRALEDAGYPLIGDDGGRLSRPQLLTGGRRFPQIRFTPEELNALDWLAAQANAGPFAEALNGARHKLHAMSASAGQEQTVAGVTDTWGASVPPTATEVLLALAEAILRRRSCRVEYQSPSSANPKVYEYHPYRLLSVAGALYCIGKVPPHDNLTTLATHRIHKLCLQNGNFEIDPAFDAERFRQESFGIIRENPVTVVLRFR